MRPLHKSMVNLLRIPWLLAAAYLIGASVFGGLATYVISVRVSSEFRDNLVNDAEEIAQRLAGDGTLALALESEARARTATENALTLANVQYAGIFRLDGRAFYESGQQYADMPSPRVLGLELVTETPSDIYVEAPIILENQLTDSAQQELLGYIRLGISKRSYQNIQHRLQYDLWTIALLFGGLFLIVLIMITQRITAPLSRLTATMTRAEETGKFATAPSEGTLEVQQIAQAYNRLMHALEQEREHLETRVRDRTAAIEQAKNEALTITIENRKLIASMNRTLEEERRHIARDIHDQLNAIIVAVRLGLQRIQTRLDNPENSAEAIADARIRIGEIIDMVAKTYTIARQIIHRLRPEIIDALGLRGAIDDMITNYNRIHPSCQFDLSMAGDFDDLGDEANIAIYRIVQEALTNTAKHSTATHVQTTIQRRGAEGSPLIYVSVEDNGLGFDTKAAHGIGILSMRERAVGVGGELNIESRMPGGTQVCATIPIPIVDHLVDGEE